MWIPKRITEQAMAYSSKAAPFRRGAHAKKPPLGTEEPSSPGKLMMVVFAYANDFDDASRFSGAQGSGVLGSYAGVYHAARS